MTPHNPERLPQRHIPALVAETIEALAVRPGGAYIDCTVGEGGHTEAILAAAPDVVVLGLDRDPEALASAHERLAAFGGRVHLVTASYTTMTAQAEFLEGRPVRGILLDLGLSSLQVDRDERGFSFLRDGPLDMRFGPEGERTAEDVVNRYRERDLAWTLFHYGEEPRSRRIARAIVQQRPIRGTAHLAQVVLQAVGRRGRIHPATRTFQAIRIEVNGELEALRTALAAAAATLHPGGRLAVISYHSLEDRLVKTAVRESPVLTAITRKPITPSREEVVYNPRSRSARLRAAERLDGGDASK